MRQITDSEQAYIDGLVKIANKQAIKEECEPHIMSGYRQEIQEWMVLRILRAQELLLNAFAQHDKEKS